MNTKAQKRKRVVSLDCKSCKRLKPNEAVETVVYMLDILLEEKILIPILAVLKSKSKLIEFLKQIGFKTKDIPRSCKKRVTSLKDISELLNKRILIDKIKYCIFQKNEEILQIISILKQEISLLRRIQEIENDKKSIEDINFILLEMFSKFKDGENFGYYNELIESYNKLIMNYPYTVFKNIIEYKISEKSDSFIKIINSLKCCNNNKYFEFDIHNKVFQFPQNRIYKRDCYITYYSKIWNYIYSSQCNAKVIVLGQPGIGKTSFIYYLLFMLKKDLSARCFDENKRQEKSKMVKQLNELLRQKNQMDKNKKYIEDKVELKKLIEEKISIISEKTKVKKSLPRINKNVIFIDLDDIINKCKEKLSKEEEAYNDDIPFDDYKPMTRFYNYMNKIYCSISDGEEFKPFKVEFKQYMHKAVYFYTMIDKKVKELEEKKELIKKDNKELNELNGYKTKLNGCKANVEKVVIEFNKAVHEYDDYVKWKKDLDILNKQKNKISNKLNIPVKEKVDEEVLKKRIKDITKAIDDNFSSSVDKVNKIVGNKDIFVVKAVNGNNTVRIYKFTKAKQLVLLKNDSISNIINSIVITDTYGDIHESNIVISISSPDNKNFEEYIKIKNHKTMYLDSFSDEEMKEWYKICIDDAEPTDFESVCKMYGNVTRQVYYHYLYENNYNKNYWEYYKELIKSVVGTIGFDDFISKYIPKNNLKDNHLSNIIMKYDLKYNEEGELQPKKSLVFVSPKIGMYVSSMLFPPKNNNDYIKILKYYTFNNDSSIHDKCIDRMLLKQIGGYKIALGEIMIKDISNYNLEVNKNSSSFSYFPFNSIVEIFYILDEDDIFDFILNGVFIKILHNDKINDDYGDNNSDKKELNELFGNVDKLSKIKEKYIISNNDNDNKIYYTVINEDEVIQSINGNIVGNIENKVLDNDDLSHPHDQSSHNSSDEIYYYKDEYIMIYRNCYKQMIKIIEENLINNENQKNYLIFGIERIGKTELADILNDYLIKQSDRNFNVLLIKKDKYSSNYYYYKIGKKVLEKVEKIPPTPPYIVISDEVVIGEDEYSDAKMIIVIGNSSDEKIKTYHSKRCPLIMYIPPFTEKEIKSLDFTNDQKKKVKKYGGIIGYYNNTEKYIIDNIIKEMKDENKKKIVKDLLNGKPKSPLSKGYSSNICIYNTYENDVTKSTRLQFLSKKVKKIANQNCIDLDVMNNS